MSVTRTILAHSRRASGELTNKKNKLRCDNHHILGTSEFILILANLTIDGRVGISQTISKRTEVSNQTKKIETRSEVYSTKKYYIILGTP